MIDKRPLRIGVLADSKMVGPHGYHSLGDKYLRAISEGMQALPVLIPAWAERKILYSYLSGLEGLLLTGAHSNIEPRHYGAQLSTEPFHDRARDSTAFLLIEMALDMDIPVFGICRGFQEINVALGGSLYQRVQALPAMMDHREDPDQPLARQYGPVHKVALESDGILRPISDSGMEAVNSLHQQGVSRLAEDLTVEARATDGLIEAFRLSRNDRFVLGVQWHPEWEVTRNQFYQDIFNLFNHACLVRQE